MKLSIIGCSGSGKSTLAKRLALRYGVEPTYMDALHFAQNWVERDDETARMLVDNVLARESWVIDGNYFDLRYDERMRDADEIVILIYPRAVCLWRVVKRYLTHRGRTRESVAPGCTEKLDATFLWWVAFQGRNRKRMSRFADTARIYAAKCTIIQNDGQLHDFARRHNMEAET